MARGAGNRRSFCIQDFERGALVELAWCDASGELDRDGFAVSGDPQSRRFDPCGVGRLA